MSRFNEEKTITYIEDKKACSEIFIKQDERTIPVSSLSYSISKRMMPQYIMGNVEPNDFIIGRFVRNKIVAGTICLINGNLFDKESSFDIIMVTRDKGLIIETCNIVGGEDNEFQFTAEYIIKEKTNGNKILSK